MPALDKYHSAWLADDLMGSAAVAWPTCEPHNHSLGPFGGSPTFMPTAGGSSFGRAGPPISSPISSSHRTGPMATSSLLGNMRRSPANDMRRSSLKRFLNIIATVSATLPLPAQNAHANDGFTIASECLTPVVCVPKMLISLCACACCSLAALLYACRDGTGEIREILTCATFSPRLPGVCVCVHRVCTWEVQSLLSGGTTCSGRSVGT
jgi:hypothetical protein